MSIWHRYVGLGRLKRMRLHRLYEGGTEEMVKVAVFRGCGRFRLSHSAVVELANRKGWNLWWRVGEIFSEDYAGMTWEQIVEEHGGHEPSGILNYYIDYVDEIYRENSWFLPHIDHQYRTDPDLISVIEEIGQEDIHIIEVPDDVEWYIEECETGYEIIRERHRTW